MEREQKTLIWRKKEILLLACIFYLLGIVTAIIIFIFAMTENEAKIENADLYSEVYVSDVRILHDVNQQKEKRSGDMIPNRLLETTTVLRSAVFLYVKENGFMPPDLSRLVQPFPHNHLTVIPRDPITFSKEVTSSYTGEGGWVYNPENVILDKTDDAAIKRQVQKAVIPNLNVKGIDSIPFDPLKIVIDKKRNQLLLISGQTIMKKYPVGLGVSGKTPTGQFSIAAKVMNPNSHFYSSEKNPYGNRALAISSIAIHGTNKPESIGENVSQGCIRMKNEDITELYSIVPLHTPIEIVQSTKEDPKMKDQSDQFFIEGMDFIYSQKDNKKEQNNEKRYQWSG